MISILFAAWLAAEKPVFTSPRENRAEYGAGLTAAEARKGWISLFDGKTTFGWSGAKVVDGKLQGGKTTAEFGACEVRIDVAAAGKIKISGKSISVSPGTFRYSHLSEPRSAIELDDNVAVRSLVVRPLRLKSVFNGKDFRGWKILKHPRRPDKTRWRIAGGAIHAAGGTGALELQRKYGNLTLQLDVRTRGKLVNGGVFFRCIPGDFMNGYEAQVFNACYDRDPAKPARYSTGAIDDRQLARRLVSRDQQTFRMTIIAGGAHIATWVNGVQMTDWTDPRAPHANPRRGRRLKPGTIQLQSHDPQTDVEFSRIRIAENK